ncbi:MAG: universal stress protein [Rubripirellula sp.]
MPTSSVLCPVDFSPASLAAIPLAIDQAEARQVFLDLLHVWQPGREYVSDGPPIPFATEQPTERIERDLASLMEEWPNAQVRYHVTSGNPADDIVSVATDLQSELVVMGTHARRGVRRWVIGSVCEPVLRHCPCPVLICRGPEQAV